MTVQYEPVIGLEIHIQLLTESKAYSNDPASYGASPNENTSPVSLGHPGTLPRVNRKVIEFAVKLGLACDCSIREVNNYARKNYFYADLPKGYQITQDTTPICTGGTVHLKTDDGKDHHIRLTRIHMEEDAGKSIHDQDPFNTLVDLNRAGVPLLEMVSEPDIRSSEEAYKYVSEVRKLVRYLGICDGNMEEGSMRCDANISVRPAGTEAFGTKVEVKNMNSMRNVQRAIEHEIKRQIEVIEQGGVIVQETRNFDAVSGTTTSMRSKEEANDYRYFPEPDICPVMVDEAFIESVRKMMPALPNQLYEKYTCDFGLSVYDTNVILENKEVALYFNQIAELNDNFKAAANWMIGPVKSYLNEKAVGIDAFPITPKQISELIDLVEEGTVSHSAASKTLFPALLDQPDKSIDSLIEELNLRKDSDTDSIKLIVEQALQKFPDKVEEYRGGKKGLVGLFMGEVMKLSGGKADPKLASKLVKEALDAQ